MKGEGRGGKMEIKSVMEGRDGQETGVRGREKRGGK